ncbi:cytochrome c oxidase assembly protein COX11, mitochondrial-like [Octopus vulgaris]|uniref:Cytochrome c oxidase assembly protein COX11, mitochondrial n=1 Tax=Octopus vulgaris TaxID=6645 RepID=A0AA36AYB3_OCTVU|nr:cytochrome c oxidase assembly protein COX11, mitochondrial-like [Octopus vulgaris]
MWNLTKISPCIPVISRTTNNLCWRAGLYKSFSTCHHDRMKTQILQSSNVYNTAIKKYFSSFLNGQNKHVSQGFDVHPLMLQRKLLKRSYKPVLFRSTSTRRGSKDAHRKRTILIYVCSVGIFMVGMSYAGVPLYRLFCQVLPGETALAFYSAKNPTDKPIIGISTYNIIPYEAAMYFNKIQCFCFEEQRLNPHEQVDMPVFFYIDPDFVEDPKLENVDTITLSYTFFEAKDGLKLPMPNYITS